MPRTFKATIALVVTLIMLAILTFLNVWQTHNAESDVAELRDQVETMADTNEQILETLESGVAVSGQASGSAQGGDKYAAALDEENNILEAQTQPLVPADAKEGGKLRRYLSSTPKGFNWMTENGADVTAIQTYAHNNLARRDYENPEKWIPELAYKVEVNDDFTEYTFHLRDDVYWQVPTVDFSKPKYDWVKERRKLTAEDVAFYFEMVKNPQVQAGSLQNYYQDLEGVEVVNDHTLKVKWKKKVHQSMSMTLEAYPLPKWLYTRNEKGEEFPAESLGKEFNNHWASRYPIGTGPYQVTKIETDSRIVLERFDKYWGVEPPVDEVEYQIIKDPQTAYTRLKGDDIDFTEMPAPSYKKDILDANPSSPFETGELEHEVVDRVVYYYLGWNADKDLFSDRRVRRAMTHAFDRQGIIDSVLHGLGKPLTGPYLPDHPANNPDVERYEFDLEKAKALLDEAGWKDRDGDGVREKTIDGKTKRFKFNMLAYNKPTARKYLAIYKEGLRKIGVTMNPSFVDWSLMQKKMDERDFDAFTGGWALGWDIDPYQLWHSSQADEPKGSNRVGFRNERADEIIETLRHTFDEDKRLELLREFHMILHEEQPYTFFFQLKSAFAWQPRVENVVFQQLRPQDLSVPWYLDESAN
ncbi:MAG: ABC transporter substrate-binding protein [Persicimonas sp.]